MAGIMAALEAHDDVGLLRQPVDDLALPFVAPLGADDDDIGHSRIFPLQLRSYEHDRLRKPHCQPGSAGEARFFRIMRPAQITAGAARMRGIQPDNGSGLSTQATTAL